jgi:pimeloyl-ACP methyl ester carboxylesterase
MKRLTVQGCPLEVVVRGSGVPLVLLHAFPLDHSMWTAQIERFASQSLVIAPDLRGFGLSGVMPGTTTMEQLADDTAEMLDQLGVSEPIVLCGLSMGGYAALQFARKYPQRLRALVLCNTRSAPDAPQTRDQRKIMVEQVLSVGAQPVADAMVPRFFTAESLERLPGTAEFVRERIMLTAPEGIAAALRGLAERPDATPLLAGISVPTLVVAGADDVVTPVSEMRAMAAAIPQAEFVVIPGVGHLSAVEAPVEFNTLLARFLAQRARSLAPAT